MMKWAGFCIPVTKWSSARELDWVRWVLQWNKIFRARKIKSRRNKSDEPVCIYGNQAEIRWVFDHFFQFINYQNSTHNLCDTSYFSRVFRLKLITQGHNSTVTFFQLAITPHNEAHYSLPVVKKRFNGLIEILMALEWPNLNQSVLYLSKIYLIQISFHMSF